MRPILLATAATLALSGLAACTPPSSAPTGAAQVQNAARTTVQGRVMVPASIIAAGGGNIISTGGGNVIATGGGNYGVLSLEEKPLANTEVFLADEAGNPIPGVKSVQTDAEGRYSLPGVPADRTVVVAAKLQTPAQKTATLQTLVKTTDLGATADVSAATTMVTASVTQKGEAVAKFNPATFRTAVDATAKHLKDDELPDWADRAAVVQKMNEMAAAIAEIKTALDEIRQELQAIKKDLAEIKDLLKRKQEQAPASGGAPVDPSNPCAGTFHFLDQDQDGAVTHEEWGVLRPDFESEEELAYGFDVADTNYDGAISLQELTAAWCGLEEEGPVEEDGEDGDDVEAGDGEDVEQF